MTVPAGAGQAAAVALPRLVVLTDRSQLPGPVGLVETLLDCVAAGLRMVVVRELDLSDADRAELVRRLLVGAPDDLLVLAARRRLPGAHGVHLSSRQLLESASRPARPTQAGRPEGVVGASCHDPAEIGAAVASSVDYLTVSPVAVTVSKPGHGPALGTEGVRRAVVAARGVPVLALGGVDAGTAAALRPAGAHGVAVMGAVMRAGDPAAVVRDLLRAVVDPR